LSSTTRVLDRQAAELVAELFEREIDAPLGLGAGGRDRAAELGEVAELDLIGRRDGSARGKQHAGGEGQSSHCFPPWWLPGMKAQRAGGAKP
jgi:hypothetical protein